ncbi:MAG: DEAD/DEAH box helicase [Ruminococcaceae bacterium]|nr:DEAD/DEAH box helicase [Oscillospiraceae bacterium]
MEIKDLKLSRELNEAISKMGFTELTPVQRDGILPVLEGQDVIVQAPTGTGKTCTFGIPLIENISPQDKKLGAVVLCPTRELVIQTAEELTRLARYKKGINIVPVYGGQPIDKQILLLKKRPQIIVATPGRLIDHLKRKTIKLRELKMLVLDEADEMLNMGFRDDLDIILKNAPEERQTVLFSATMPQEIIDIADNYQKENPVHIKVTGEELTVSTVKQYYLEIKLANRTDAIGRLIDANKYKLCMIFCNTKKKVDEICAELRQKRYPAEALHGDMKQMQRDRVMSRFKKGLAGILVATDVAARGIDIDGVDAVFNYEIPDDFEYYVHRIGRTGRAGNEGVSYTFASGRDIKKLKELMKYTKSEIVLGTLPSLKEVKKINLEGIRDTVIRILENDDVSDYHDYIDSAFEGVPSSHIAAALLKLMNEGEKKEEDKPGNEDFVRMFVNIGKMDKMGTNNMIDLLKSGGVSFEQIGKIDIGEKFSFIELEREASEIVTQTLNGTYYKKRKITFELSGKKKKEKPAVSKKQVKKPSSQGRRKK